MLLRKLFAVALLLCCCVAPASVRSSTSDFDTQGFDQSRSFSIQPSVDAIYPLTLLAAGMRRKTIVFVNVDVYKVGVFISAALDEQVRSLHPAAESCLHLSDPLAEASSELSADAASLGIVLRFVRDVDSGKIVSAMQEALLPPNHSDPVSIVNNSLSIRLFVRASQGKGTGEGKGYDVAVGSFMELLKSATGDAGLKKADELIFLWHGSETVTILKNDLFVGSVNNDLLRRRLVDVYVGEQAVAPEVAAAVKRRYQPSH
eukprot:gene34577-44695_t